MPSEFDPGLSHFSIRLLGGDERFPSLLDVSSFFYDFNLLYEVTRLATDPKYHDFKFTDYVLYRGGRPLERGDRLHVQALRQESPLLLVAVIAAVPTAVAAIWGIVQITEKVANARINRRKLRAEVEKLERENLEAAHSPLELNFEDAEQLRTLLKVREAERYYENIGGRLRRSSVRIKEIDIELIQSKKLRGRG